MKHIIRLYTNNIQQKPLFMTRRCGLCRQNGHDRRNCPQRQQNVQQVDQQICMLCNGAHNPYDCPILQDEPNDDHDEPNDEHYDHVNIQYIQNEYSDIDHRIPPQPPPPSPSSKIHWDKCGQCGKQNQGKICSCGAKMITQVPCNSDGFYECTICYNELKDLNKVTTKCGHHFCVDCFLSHYTSNQGMSGKCPMCRTELLEQQRISEQHSHPAGIIRYIARYIHNF